MRTVQEVEYLAGVNKPVTKEEADSLVRHIQRTCRGKAVLSVDDMRALHTEWDEAAASGIWDQAVDVCLECEDATCVVGPKVDFGDWEALARRTLGAIYAHGDTIGKPCGADFNDTICAQPFDGKTRTAECPKCGATNVFTSPVFVISE